MLAMAIDAGTRRLVPVHRPRPAPGPRDVLVRVRACGVCRTDLHILDGELARREPPAVPGHEVVGEVLAMGDGARRFAPGQRVGIGWNAYSCLHCDQCIAGRWLRSILARPEAFRHLSSQTVFSVDESA